MLPAAGSPPKLSTLILLTGLFLRLILCCVVGVDVEELGGERGDGVEDGAGIEMNPTFDDGR